MSMNKREGEVERTPLVLALHKYLRRTGGESNNSFELRSCLNSIKGDFGFVWYC